MSPLTILFIASVPLTLAIVGVAVLLLQKRRQARRLTELNEELIAVSGDASVGRRLSASGSADINRLTSTINRLFDALGERDDKIQDRDKLFSDFARTLPEIVLVHDEKILQANNSAGGLI